MPIWDKPAGSSDIRCPGAYCCSWLTEVAPGVLQCWQCLVMGKAYAFSEVRSRGKQFAATLVVHNRASGGYHIGEAAWRLDRSGHVEHPSDWALYVANPMDVSAEDSYYLPLPVIPSPWPTSFPKELARWRPEWAFPQTEGPKILAQQA
jgi:hypothetical protein